MRKIFAVLFLAVFAVSISANDLPSSASYSYEWGGLARGGYDNAGTEFDGDFTDDTCSGTDTDTILKEFVPEQGWEYIYYHDAPTGSGDSVEIILKVLCKDADGNALSTVTVDSVDGENAGAYWIPFYSTCIGEKFWITRTGGADNGGTAAMANHYLGKRRPITWFRNWK